MRFSHVFIKIVYMINKIFKNKKLNESKLINYGFNLKKINYSYTLPLLNGDFLLRVEISNSGEIKTTLTETETNDLYTLHLTDAQGNFVGKIREEYRAVLEDIAEKCFDDFIFKSDYSYKVIDYVKEKYGDDVEYLWEKFPENAVARRKDNSKWYLAILTVRADKLGFESKENIEVIDLRAEVNEIPDLLKQDNIYPAYHMNKTHWITIILDGSMGIKEIYNFIDKSYSLADKKKTKSK